MRRLLDSGVDAAMSVVDVRHVRATNIGALAGAICIGLWSPMAFAAGAPGAPVWVAARPRETCSAACHRTGGRVCGGAAPSALTSCPAVAA